MATDREELLLLRIQDPDVAERLNAVLLEKPDAPKDPVVELRFDGERLSAYYLHVMMHQHTVLCTVGMLRSAKHGLLNNWLYSCRGW